MTSRPSVSPLTSTSPRVLPISGSAPAPRSGPDTECKAQPAGGVFLRWGLARAVEATRLRGLFRAWVAGRGVPAEAVEDLTLAVYEALTNVVDHAYPADQPGPVALYAHHTPETVAVVVRDLGRWDPSASGGTRGRGLALIEALVAEVRLEAGPEGTSLHLTHRHTRPPWVPVSS